MKKLILMLVTLLPVAAFGGNKKLAKDLPTTGDHSVTVIIQYKVAPQQKHRDKITAHGGWVKDSVDLVKGILAHVPASKISAIPMLPSSRRIARFSPS